MGQGTCQDNNNELFDYYWKQFSITAKGCAEKCSQQTLCIGLGWLMSVRLCYNYFSDGQATQVAASYDGWGYRGAYMGEGSVNANALEYYDERDASDPNDRRGFDCYKKGILITHEFHFFLLQA